MIQIADSFRRSDSSAPNSIMGGMPKPGRAWVVFYLFFLVYRGSDGDDDGDGDGDDHICSTGLGDWIKISVDRLEEGVAYSVA